jgi:release factor glutamine methyltransferase
MKSQTLKVVEQEFILQLSALYEEGEVKAILKLLLENLFIENDNTGNVMLQMIDENQHNILMAYLVRLKKAEPVQYILGYAYFLNFKVKVNRDVLIPRPETEELVEMVMNSEKDSRLNMLDIGTGSGCIALALASHFKKSVLFASDVSAAALAIAQTNANDYGLPVHFIHDSILEPQWKVYPQTLHVLVSNPPYISHEEKNEMHANVVDHEPYLALFTTQHPLEFYQAILKFAEMKLSSGGRIYLELNPLFALEIQDMFSSAGFQNVTLINDIDGKKRFMRCNRL